MKKFLSGLLSAALIMQCTVFAAVNAEAVFADLEGHWAQATVEKMAGLGIAKGRADGIFAPEDNITRAEFLTLVCRITGTNELDFEVCLLEKAENHKSATIRVEFTADGTTTPTTVTFNGTELTEKERAETEFFPVYSSGSAYPTSEKVKFFDIPLSIIKTGNNHVNIKAQGLTMDGVQIAFHN